MLQGTSTLYLIVLCIAIAVSIVVPLFAEDKSKIWSPITVIGLVLIYYVVWPSIKGLNLYGAGFVQNQPLFYLTAVVFFGCILLAFNFTRDTEYIKWNGYFTVDNSQKVAIVLFIIALVCYVPFRGFRTSISADTATVASARIGLVSYFIDLIAILVGACSLAYVGLKDTEALLAKKHAVLWGILYFTLILFIVGGFRYRIVILILAMATMYHLFPEPKKINFIVLVPVAIAAFLGFAIMDKARSYGRGIDMEAARNVSMDEALKGAGENVDVCCFSIVVTDEYSKAGGNVGMEPIVTAILMPIPRAIFPSKPDGNYMREAQIRTIGDADGGAAVLIFTEAYMSFGMFGVIIYGLFVGFCCKKVWSNYRNNPDSIGAILFLALFNGFCYTWISRGYMAGAFNDFIYFAVLPFAFAYLVNKFSKAPEEDEDICD